MTNVNQKIKNLLNSLNEPTLNLKKIKRQMDLISEIKEERNFNYLEDLMYPETRKGVKIPSEKPVPSCTFCLRNSIMISSNQNGCFLYKFNPYFLAQESLAGGAQFREYYEGNPGFTRFWYPTNPFSSLFRIDSVYLDGQTELAGAQGNLKPVFFNQVIPNNIYSQYRLVSGSINLRYIGPLEECQGVIGSAISFDSYSTIGARYTSHVVNGNVQESPYVYPDTGEGPANNRQTPYIGIFDGYRDMFYSCENSCLEGIRMLYFPPEPQYENFIRIIDGKNLKMDWAYRTPTYKNELYFWLPEDYYRAKFWFNMYGQGLPEQKEYFRLDVDLNFECIPTATFMNYCPLSAIPYSLSMKQRACIWEELKKHVAGKALGK